MNQLDNCFNANRTRINPSLSSVQLFFPPTGLFVAYWQLVLLFYTLFADGMFVGQSIGKKLMKLYVVRSDTEEPCTYGRSVLRNITYLLGIFDFIFIFGPTKRRLGDRLAKTKVVMKRLGE